MHTSDAMFKPLWNAAQRGQQHLVQSIVSEAPGALRFRRHALSCALNVAAHNAHAGTVSVLLCAKADFTWGDTLRSAAYAGDPDDPPCDGAEVVPRRMSALELVLEAKACPNAGRGWETALGAAAKMGHAGAADILVRAKADIELACNYGFRLTPLDVAARYGNIAVIQVLVRANACLNSTTPSGLTPACHAATLGNAEAVRILAHAKADVDKGSDSPAHIADAPAHTAAANGHVAVVCVLAELKADLSKCRARDGYSPLHIAARSGRVNVLRALVGFKVDVGAVMRDERTAAHCAVQYGQTAALLALVRMRADVDAARADGTTVAQLAAFRAGR